MNIRSLIGLTRRRSEGIALGSLAILHHEQGRIPDVLEHYQRALAIAREVGNRRSEGVTLGNLGDLLFSQGGLLSAEPHLRDAITILDQVFPTAAGAFRGSLALIRAQQGAFDEARSLLAQGEPQLRGGHKRELGKPRTPALPRPTPRTLAVARGGPSVAAAG